LYNVSINLKFSSNFSCKLFIFHRLWYNFAISRYCTRSQGVRV